MRTAVRVRLGALAAGAALGGLGLAGQASAAPPMYGVPSPTPVTVSVPAFITLSGAGGPLAFGSVLPGTTSGELGPLFQNIKTNNATGYGFFADWTGLTAATVSASPPVLSLRLDAAPAGADFIGPPISSYAPIGTFFDVPTGQSQIALVHSPTSTPGDTFQDTARVTVPSGGTSGDYSGTLTFNAYTLP
jgi:hypothetical protein